MWRGAGALHSPRSSRRRPCTAAGLSRSLPTRSLHPFVIVRPAARISRSRSARAGVCVSYAVARLNQHRVHRDSLVMAGPLSLYTFGTLGAPWRLATRTCTRSAVGVPRQYNKSTEFSTFFEFVPFSFPPVTWPVASFRRSARSAQSAPPTARVTATDRFHAQDGPLSFEALCHAASTPHTRRG